MASWSSWWFCLKLEEASVGDAGLSKTADPYSWAFLTLYHRRAMTASRTDKTKFCRIYAHDWWLPGCPISLCVPGHISSYMTLGTKNRSCWRLYKWKRYMVLDTIWMLESRTSSTLVQLETQQTLQSTANLLLYMPCERRELENTGTLCIIHLVCRKWDSWNVIMVNVLLLMSLMIVHIFNMPRMMEVRAQRCKWRLQAGREDRTS